MKPSTALPPPEPPPGRATSPGCRDRVCPHTGHPIELRRTAAIEPYVDYVVVEILQFSGHIPPTIDQLKYSGSSDSTTMPTRKRRGAKRSAKSTSASSTAAVRAWAADNGHPVSARGRIPTSVLSAYDVAHKRRRWQPGGPATVGRPRFDAAHAVGQRRDARRLHARAVAGVRGTGGVYLADNRRTSERLALKTIRADVSADSDFRVRFHRDVELAALSCVPIARRYAR